MPSRHAPRRLILPPAEQRRSVAPSPEHEEDDNASVVSDGCSTYTYHDSHESFFFQKVWERILPRQPSVYALPVDEQESKRLDIGHDMIVMAAPGLFVGPAHDVLDPLTSDYPKRILDIGTGNGTWAMAVADMYSGCTVTGVDIVPLQPRLRNRIMPPNCSFQLQDANIGLPPTTASIDLVHARNVQLGIINYPQFIEECARTLKPGGLLNLIEGDWDIFDSDGQPCTPFKNPGWFHWMHSWRLASAQRRIDISAPEKTEGWLKASPYLKGVKSAGRWMPVGPWTPDESQNRLGTIVWENLAHLIPSIKPLLCEFFNSEDVANRIISQAWGELGSAEVHVFMRWRFFHAIRNDKTYRPPDAAPSPSPSPPPRQRRRRYINL